MKEVTVTRTEDMSPDGKLTLIQQDDGDIVVVVQGESRHGMPNHGDVEFCIPGTGGGASPETHRALMHLMEAMAADNERRAAKPSERAGIPVDAIGVVLRGVHKHLACNEIYTQCADIVDAWLNGTTKSTGF